MNDEKLRVICDEFCRYCEGGGRPSVETLVLNKNGFVTKKAWGYCLTQLLKKAEELHVLKINFCNIKQDTLEHLWKSLKKQKLEDLGWRSSLT